MFKAYAVHYKNKYPKSQTRFDENSLDVFSENNRHLVAVRKTGAGSIKDCSKELGCFEEHDLSPIPKQARCYKLYADGNIGLAEEYDERRAWVKEQAEIEGSKVEVKSYGLKVLSEK